MEFNWFLLFNRAEFLATGLVSRTLKVTLEGIGEKEILITLGNELSITYDGVLLPINLTGKNPFIFEERAVFQDEDEDVWLGVKI